MGMLRCDSGSEGERTCWRAARGGAEFNWSWPPAPGVKVGGAAGVVGGAGIVNFDELLE
jgi:hypothetical protein